MLLRSSCSICRTDGIISKFFPKNILFFLESIHQTDKSTHSRKREIPFSSVPLPFTFCLLLTSRIWRPKKLCHFLALAKKEGRGGRDGQGTKGKVSAQSVKEDLEKRPKALSQLLPLATCTFPSDLEFFGLFFGSTIQ